MCIFCDIKSAALAYDTVQEGRITYMLAQMMAAASDEEIRTYASEWLQQNENSRAVEMNLTPDNLVARLRLIAQQPGAVVLEASNDKAFPYVILSASLFGPSDNQVMQGVKVTRNAYAAVTAKLQQEGHKWADVPEEASMAKADEIAKAAAQRAFDAATNGTKH